MANLPVPVPRTFTVGETETGSYFNSQRDALNFLIGLPIATVYQATSQTFGGVSSLNPISFDATAVDSYGGHSNTVNPTRYVAQVAGWYLVGGACIFNGAFSGTSRKIQVYLNGTAIPYAAAQVPLVSGSLGTNVPLSPTIVFMNVGDFVSIYGSADVNAITTAVGLNASYMTVFWVHN